MRRKATRAEAKFRDGQVVLYLPDWEYVRVKETYLGRMRVKESIQTCCIIEWPYGKMTSTYERCLVALTKRECGGSSTKRVGKGRTG